MKFVASALLIVGLTYAGIFTVLALKQRSLLYQPRIGLISPALAGLSNFETLWLATGDRETLEAWFAAPMSQSPLVLLYFHGNAGSLADRADRFRKLTHRGFGLLAVSYRGYGGSSGAPSEDGLLQDAEAAYAEARRRGFAPERIVVMGESLGTGVATMISARRETAALVLDSPYASMVEVASTHFPMFPVGFVLRDRFRADEAIGDVQAPVLMLVGARDPVTPAESARRLFARAREPKTLFEFTEAGHLAIDDPDAMRQTMEWIDASVPKSTLERYPAR